MSRERVLFLAEGIADGTGVDCSPGGALVELPDPSEASEAVLLAAGQADTVAAHPLASGARLEERLEGMAILPGLVNAHTHLDLTHVGPREFTATGGFAAWADMIRKERRTDPEGIEAAVREGVRRSLAGGVVAVGDIAGAMRLTPFLTLRESCLIGVSFLEFFGLGERQEGVGARLEAMLDEQPDLLAPSPVRLGLQPHAPYSVGPALYAKAVEIAKSKSLPLATHLAETMAERMLIGQGEGPFVDMLRKLDVWDERAAREVGEGRSPIGHVRGELARAPFLLAHVNDCDDDDLAALRESGASVAYCPRASAYFGHDREFGPHRYREMLDSGINVALGTDSIVNLPQSQSHRLSTLDEMRLLWRRDGTPAHVLLAMGTVNGARALGLDTSLFSFRDIGSGRRIGGLVGVEVGGTRARHWVCERVLASDGDIHLLVGPNGQGREAVA